MKTKIVNEVYTDKQGEIACSEVMIKYNQQDDLSGDELQTITVQTQDIGGGNYFVISTERWSFDSIDELILVLKDFKKKAGIK